MGSTGSTATSTNTNASTDHNDGTKPDQGEGGTGRIAQQPFSASAPAEGGLATATAVVSAARPGEFSGDRSGEHSGAHSGERASPPATTIDVGGGDGVVPRAVFQQQQPGQGHGWQGVQPFGDGARGDGGGAAGSNAAVSCAVTAMTVASSATASDGTGLPLPVTTPDTLTLAHGNGIGAVHTGAGAGAGAGVPLEGGVGAAYCADDVRVPIAAVVDRAACPAGVGGTGGPVAGAGRGNDGGEGSASYPKRHPHPHLPPAGAPAAGGGDLAGQGGAFMA